MARPLKQGLDYFPLNVDFLSDVKIRKIMRGCGSNSIAILISLLGNIYKDEGYYIWWDNDMPFLISDEVGVSEGAVCEVVNKALQVGIFNQELYSAHQILTSKGIQERFWAATSERGKVDISAAYCLLDEAKLQRRNINLVNHPKNGVIRPKNPVIPPENAQRKEKESTAKESKDIIVGTGVPTPPTQNEPQARARGRPTKTFSHDSVEYKSSKFLADKILERDPKTKKVPRTDEGLQKWCVHIDYILRLDGRTVDELRKVLAYAVRDSFWSTNILSTAKLREKFDTLLLQLAGKESRTTDGIHSADTGKTGFNPAGMSGFKNALDRFDEEGNERVPGMHGRAAAEGSDQPDEQQ